MKNIKKYTLGLILILSLSLSYGQDLEYSFANASSNGSTYSVDVLISSPNNLGFKLGNGQIYINYNPDAFGPSAFAAGNVTVDNSGGVLANQHCLGIAIDNYGNFVLNDNGPSTISYAWVQERAAVEMATTITNSPILLFRLILTFNDNSQEPNVCFESTGVFQDVTFTACGPDGVCGGFNGADCQNNGGSLLTNTSFDCSNSVLPIYLLSFTANKAGNSSINLDWSTSSEINSSHFDIERSIDGSSWEVIGKITAAGNSSSVRNYNYVDRNIDLRRNSTKVFYYRLNMIDQDASQEYSEVKAVRLTNEGYADVTVFPNPTAELLNIDVSSDLEDGNIKYEITDIKGRRLITESIDISVQRIHTVNLRDKGLKSGVYMVRLFNNREILSAQKVVLVSH